MIETSFKLHLLCFIFGRSWLFLFCTITHFFLFYNDLDKQLTIYATAGKICIYGHPEKNLIINLKTLSEPNTSPSGFENSKSEFFSDSEVNDIIVSKRLSQEQSMTSLNINLYSGGNLVFTIGRVGRCQMGPITAYDNLISTRSISLVFSCRCHSETFTVKVKTKCLLLC